jgi:hypothetical protein
MMQNKKIKFMLRFTSLPVIVPTILTCLAAAMNRFDYSALTAAFVLGSLSMLGWSIIVGMFITMKGIRK